MQLDISNIKPFICLDCIAGSKAYGLDTPTSDDDFKGVFLAPLPMILTGQAPTLVQDERMTGSILSWGHSAENWN